MKRLFLTLFLTLGLALQAAAMSYDEARQQAWFLTDKMAYELNLTPEQYDRAYEINLEYLMSLRTASDVSGYYWRYRDTDLRYILFDWQYNLYCTLDYFFRPVRWVRTRWYYPICDHYRTGYYYFNRPTVYITYKGGTWRRRSHNDYSPYRNVHIDRGYGMRDRYISRSDYPNRPNGRINNNNRNDHMPNNGNRNTPNANVQFGNGNRNNTFGNGNTNRNTNNNTNRRQHTTDKSKNGFINATSTTGSINRSFNSTTTGSTPRTGNINNSSRTLRTDLQNTRNSSTSRTFTAPTQRTGASNDRSNSRPSRSFGR